MEVEAVEIGGGDGARITLRPVMRSHLATDFWDGNWLDTAVRVSAGAFQGEYLATLRAEELVAFRRDLERLYKELQGVGRFHSMEHWVEIDVTGDGRGHFAAACRARDRAGDGNVLHFDLSFDQTEIPRMVQQLLAIEAAFPVLGQPGG